MLHPASGTGVCYSKTAKIIRFALKGCANRPFYHIVVTERRRGLDKPVIEQLGSYDPLANQYNEKLVALNFERIQYWIGRGAHVSDPILHLLGLSGFYPVHPTSFMTAWRNREEQLKQEQQKESATS